MFFENGLAVVVAGIQSDTVGGESDSARDVFSAVETSVYVYGAVFVEIAGMQVTGYHHRGAYPSERRHGAVRKILFDEYLRRMAQDDGSSSLGQSFDPFGDLFSVCAVVGKSAVFGMVVRFGWTM